MPRRKQKHTPIGEQIRTARESAGLTQAQLAEATGLHQVLISQYETGVRKPPVPHLILLAEVLDVDFAWSPTVIVFRRPPDALPVE